MKKILFFLTSLILTIGLFGQTTNKDVIVNKAGPLIHANGTGAVIKWYNTTITESGGKLTVSDKIASTNFIQGYTTTATATSTTTLTAVSSYLQFFTGSLAQTVVLPVASTLQLGHQFYFINNSTGLVTIQSSGANTIAVLASDTRCRVTCILASGTDAASWSFYYQANSIASGKKLTISNSLTLAGVDAQVVTFPVNTSFGYATTATAGSTTTLTNASSRVQYFTGTLAQTITLPVCTTLALGWDFLIVNNSTGVVTVNTSGAATVIVIPPSNSALVTCILASGTTIASWSAQTFARLDAGQYFTGNQGIGYSPFYKLSVIGSRAANLNVFNASFYDLNKIRTTAATESDTSSLSLGFSYTGSPTLSLKGKTGNELLKVDSVKITTPAQITLTGNDALVLSGSATYWDDLMFPSHSLKSVGTTAKPDYDVVGQTLDFPEDTTEAIGFAVQMPHDWLEGSTIWPHVHWLRESADSVDWTFRYKWFNIGTALPDTWTQKKLSHNTQTWTTGTIHELSRVVDAVGISGSGKTLSSMLVIKFYRKSDPYSGDAKLLELDIHYERDGLGSRTESAK